MGVDEVTPCAGILVPPLKIKSALECKKVTVPTLVAERDKCRRDADIRMKLYLAREDLLKKELAEQKEANYFNDKILAVSISVLSGILIGVFL